ncbi:MAG: hypothetical protein M9936_15585 [Caldilinea sp.]|nr:hypothetical protein [Caldilineaceae bacterium]MCO5211114.1 hypothetical protein [Caldilinea sp.]
MEPIATFGSEDHYYAGRYGQERRNAQQNRQLEKDIEHFLHYHMPDAETRVRQVVKQWNQPIRNAIIADTGLRLVLGNEQQSVPVRIHPGLPWPFADLVQRIPFQLWELLFNQNLLRSTIRGTQLVIDNSDVVRAQLQTEVDVRAIEYTRDIVSSLLERLGGLNLDEEFRGINEDILGAYFFRIPEVRIYWMAIGMLARILGVNVEALTTVVLIHELAHAYTHLGRDVDGIQWSTIDFAKTETHTVEGLAQFYTAQICDKYRLRNPELRSAFESLLNLQPEAYTAFRNWGQVNDRHIGEIVRFAMVSCRSKSIRTYQEFLKDLEQARGQVGGTDPIGEE